MGWIVGMQRAINYVEEHLKERLDYEEIAKQADCSSYYFQKIFGTGRTGMEQWRH